MTGMTKKRILLIGHGKTYGNHFRCSPLPLSEILTIMNDATVIMVDNCPDFVNQDIVFDVTEDWECCKELVDLPCFDIIIEAVSPLASNLRKNRNYWKGVLSKLAPHGVYYGWASARPRTVVNNITRETLKALVDISVPPQWCELAQPRKTEAESESAV